MGVTSGKVRLEGLHGVGELAGGTGFGFEDGRVVGRLVAGVASFIVVGYVGVGGYVVDDVAADDGEEEEEGDRRREGGGGGFAYLSHCGGYNILWHENPNKFIGSPVWCFL